jgi:hypothetical protein
MRKRTTTPFLGSTTDRNAAFPGIEQIEFTVTQDSDGCYLREVWQRSARYSKADLPSHVRCANPRCQQGGLQTQQIVLFHPEGEHIFWCNGQEGTPAGRRKGDPCDNRFIVTLKVTRSLGSVSADFLAARSSEADI